MTPVARAEVASSRTGRGSSPTPANNSASRSLSVNSSFDATYWMLISANAHLGRIDEAINDALRKFVLTLGIERSTLLKVDAGLRDDPVAEDLPWASGGGAEGLGGHPDTFRPCESGLEGDV